MSTGSSDDSGTVVRFGGRGGKTLSIETTFVEAVEERKRQVDDVYAVIGPDSSDEFRRRLEKVCPVIVDPDAKGVCLQIDGKPSEWQAARAS